MAGRSTLVIYFITVLDVPIEVLMKIDSIRRAFLWAASEKVSGGKCKVNWELVCKPKDYGGLGILNLKKFVSALRLRWLWHEWNDESKPWRDLGNPCTTKDHELFASSTKVTIGTGKKALFWEATWLEGMRPKDIAPLIFDRSKRRKCTVHKAMENDFWVAQINTHDGLSVEHIAQFYTLWEMLSNVHLDMDAMDKITWKFTNDGCYSAKSAYKMQFSGLHISPMPSLVWKPWAPPKCKIFVWLILQN
jgi:hypothetical protein